MSKIGLIYIDCEYCFTCAVHQGMIPNYKQMVDMLNKHYPKNEKYAYFLGPRERKKTVADFLLKQGVDFVNIINLRNVMKPQVIASQIALDVYKRIIDFEPGEIEIVFIGGGDYLIPIVDFVYNKGVSCTVFYYQVILSHYLFDRGCKLEKFSNSFFAHRSDNDGNDLGFDPGASKKTQADKN